MLKAELLHRYYTKHKDKGCFRIIVEILIQQVGWGELDISIHQKMKASHLLDLKPSEQSLTHRG